MFDGNGGSFVGLELAGSTLGYNHYDFWFHEFITDTVKIYFYGSQNNYLSVTEVSFWGCNMTSTAPTAIPTLSPSQIPTNSIQTVLPTVSPTDMPSNLLTVSPTQVPIGTNDSNDHVIIAIKVTELLGGVIVLLLLAVVIFMCIQFRKRKISQSAHPEAMLEKLDMADNKTAKVRSDGEICVSEGGVEIRPQQSAI